jgi:hypothetical protein
LSAVCGEFRMLNCPGEGEDVERREWQREQNRAEER